MPTKLSIVIPSYNPDEEKKDVVTDCLASLRNHTDCSYEIIIVDNGSTYAVDNLRYAADIYVRNNENLGYAKAVNQGYKLAKGDYIAICNDDIIVAPFWASGLIATAGGTSISMPALMREDLYKKEETVHDALKRVQESKFWEPTYKTVEPFGANDGFGALYLAHKETWERLEYPRMALLDEGYEYMMFEDRDLWRRGDASGVQRLRDHSVWVHHGGNTTWGKLDIDHEAVYRRNEDRFRKSLGL